ncbi:MAG: putative monooxygenase [Geminicoccaceae bacterium]|nr:putative monooxygenase [Geminicoccaceae bacterium]
MPLNNTKIIVVGGGTGGTAAALLLARAGARVTLLERVAEPRAVGAGIAIAENGLAVLESLGLGPALEVGRPVDGARIVDASGRTLIAVGDPQPRVAMLRRSTLQGILLDALASESGIERRFGTEVMRATADGKVIVREGASEVTLAADLVIGADGVHSRVREGGAFGARVRRSGLSYVRMLVDDGLATGTEAWTPAGVFGAFAVDEGTYAFASCGLPACRAALASRDLDAFRTAWAHAYAPAGRVLGAVRRFDELLVNEVIQVRCARWFDGRLVLLGDAAHAMAPNLGQGANSALVDAAALLDELCRARTIEGALGAYDRRRRPAVRRVAVASARLGRLAEVTHPVPRTLRDRILVPVLRAFASPRTTAMMLQEPTARLLDIGAHDCPPFSGRSETRTVRRE